MAAAVRFDTSDPAPAPWLSIAKPERKAKLRLVPAQQRATKTASPLSRAAGVGGEGRKAWHSPLLMDFRGSAAHYPSFDRHRRSSGLRRLPRTSRRDSASGGPICVSTWTRAEPDAARMCFGYVGGLGYYHDQDLSMPLLSIRHYQPRTGLFIARDPVLTEPRYRYVGGVPTARVDASGRLPWPPPVDAYPCAAYLDWEDRPTLPQDCSDYPQDCRTANDFDLVVCVADCLNSVESSPFSDWWIGFINPIAGIVVTGILACNTIRCAEECSKREEASDKCCDSLEDYCDQYAQEANL